MYSPKIFRHLVIPIVCSLLCACSVQKNLTDKVNITYKDSTIVHIDTVQVQVPKEVIKEVVYADSSHLETTVAYSDAVIDTLGYLHHSIANKPVNLKKEVIYKDRIIQRDTTIYKDIPVEVDKIVTKTPKWCWISLALNIIVIIIIGIKIYLKLK